MRLDEKGTLRLTLVAIPTATAAKMLYTFTRPVNGDLICTTGKLFSHNGRGVETQSL